MPPQPRTAQSKQLYTVHALCTQVAVATGLPVHCTQVYSVCHNIAEDSKTVQVELVGYIAVKYCIYSTQQYSARPLAGRVYVTRYTFSDSLEL